MKTTLKIFADLLNSFFYIIGAMTTFEYAQHRWSGFPTIILFTGLFIAVAWYFWKNSLAPFIEGIKGRE